MLILPSSNTVMKTAVFKRLTAKKREACEFTFSDFDNVSFRVRTPLENKDALFIDMDIPFWAQIADAGAADGLKRIYGDYIDGEFDDGKITLKLLIDDFDEAKAEEFSDLASNIKNNVIGEVLRLHLKGIKEGTPLTENVEITPRDDTAIFIQSGKDRVNVSFALSFSNKTDRLIGNFFKEFVETKRKMGAAPICNYSATAPSNLSRLLLSHNQSLFHSFHIALLEKHVEIDSKIDSAVDLLLGFRQFIGYHIKSSKSYFHQRMRKQVASLLKILNRAKAEKEKKSKTFSGKTFKRT